MTLRIGRLLYSRVYKISKHQRKRFLTSLAEAHERNLHRPVLLSEVIELLNPQNGKIYVDMTFGAGGHTNAILDFAPSSSVFCLDRDPTAYEMATKLAEKRSCVTPFLGKFSSIHQLLDSHGIGKGSVDGMLFDVGASSMQFDDPERGFSCSINSPLDMRMSQAREEKEPSAAEVINHLSESDLYKIIHSYGEEKHARAIARAILDHRYAFGPIKDTHTLTQLVKSVYQVAYTQDKLQRPSHVATKTFQALRIFVNNELNELNNGLEIAHWLLKPGGVCVVISFHSLEDRIVKRHFHAIDMEAPKNMSLGDQKWKAKKTLSKEELENILTKKWEPINRKVITATDEEITRNPRSRSAKLRAAQKS